MVALGGFAMPGEKSVANFDEDSVTMAVEAANDCITNADRKSIDGLFLATTTAPLLEKQGASIAAIAADLGEEILTADFGDSLRAGTNALRMAADAIKAGSSKRILVTASDKRRATPLSMIEQNIGDGAAALVVGKTGVIASIENSYSLSSAYIDVWRYPGDNFVHTWQDRFFLNAGFTPTMKKAMAAAMKKFGVEPKDITTAVYTAPDSKTHGNIGKACGFKPAQIQNPLFEVMGHTGAAFPLMLLVSALEKAKAGDKIIVASYGDGVDVLLLQVTDAISKFKKKRAMSGYLKSGRKLSSYLRYLRMNHYFPAEKSRFADIIPGLAQLWRERNSLLKFHASKCNKCGWTEYPIKRICPKCRNKDDYTEVRLVDKKAILFSYSTDTNPMNPEYTDAVCGRGIIEFPDGARCEGELTDWGDDVDELDVNMPMEMTFRRYERQGDVPAYAWKPRRVR